MCYNGDMAQALKDERACFPRGQQNKFILLATERAKGLETLAHSISVCPRTVRDWRREKFLMPYRAADLIAKRYKIELPHALKTKEKYWYVHIGAQKGGFASFKKQGGQIGDPTIRKQKWYEWWETEGKFKDTPIFHALPFKQPRPSEHLAEFMGIMMGDGGMSNRQMTITLHHVDDLEYSKFVIRLIEEMFGIKPAVYHYAKDSVNDIVISRTGLVRYMHDLGLPIGNKIKQNIDIPGWIKKNPRYLKACARGLFDTDGSVFAHRYRVNGKLYSYKKICFSSTSIPLRDSVFNYWKSLGLSARISQEVDVRIECQDDVKKYFKIMGTQNPKHWKRYKSLV